ncbi:MAG: hypothetical protein J3K34DRAFT_524096 [Monoraphidium minutum]|nr:MAG: hypothetical protein J3K34DRAFT_524096 [Monoraphidium minutum]
MRPPPGFSEALLHIWRPPCIPRGRCAAAPPQAGGAAEGAQLKHSPPPEHQPATSMPAAWISAPPPLAARAAHNSCRGGAGRSQGLRLPGRPVWCLPPPRFPCTRLPTLSRFNCPSLPLFYLFRILPARCAPRCAAPDHICRFNRAPHTCMRVQRGAAWRGRSAPSRSCRNITGCWGERPAAAISRRRMQGHWHPCGGLGRGPKPALSYPILIHPKP